MHPFLHRWLSPKARRSKHHLRQFLLGCVLLTGALLGMVLCERLLPDSLGQELIALSCHILAVLAGLYALGHYLALWGGRLYRLFTNRRPIR